MRFWKNKSIIVFGIVLVLLSMAFFAVRPTIIEKTHTLTLEMGAKLLNADLQVGKIEMPNPTKVQINNLVITKDAVKIAEIPRLTLNLALWNIFSDNQLLLVDTISVRNPTIRLRMEEDSSWNIADLLKPQPPSENKLASLIVLTDAKVEVDLNGKLLKGNINGSLDARSANDNFVLDLNTEAEYVGNLKVVGMINVNRQGRLAVQSDHLALPALQDLIKTYIPQVTQLKGSVENVDIIWQNEKDKKLLNGHFNNKNVLIAYQYSPEKLFNAEVNGGLSFKDGEIRFDQTKVKINEQQVNLSGGILGKNEAWLPNNLKINLVDAELSKVLVDDRIQGKINAEMILNSQKGELLMEGTVTGKQVKGFDYTAQDVKIPFKLEQNKLRVQNATLKTLNGKVSLNVLFDLKTKEYSMDLDGEEVDLSQAQLSEDLQGRAKVKFLATGNMEQMDQIDGAGTLRLSSFAYKGIDVQDLSVEVAKIKENIGFNNGLMKLSNGSSVAFMGNISKRLADVFFVAEGLRLEMLRGLTGVDAGGAASISGRVHGDLQNPDLQVQINAGTGHLYGQNFEGLNASGSVHNKKLNINSLTVLTSPILDTLSGKYSVSGTVDFAQASPWLDLRVQADMIRIDGLADDLLQQKITGYFSTDTKVQGSIANPSLAGWAWLEQGSFMGLLLRSIRVDYDYNNGRLNLPKATVSSITGMSMVASGQMAANGNLDISFNAKDLNITLLPLTKNYNHEGRVSIDGKVSGKFNRPQLEGRIYSDWVKIAGHRFTDLRGDISSDAGMITNATMNFRQENGAYNFEGGLDYPNSFVYGKIITSNANIKPLLAIADYDINVDGFLDGEIHLNRRGKGSGLEIIGNLQGAKIADVPLRKAEVDVLLDRQKFVINKVLAAQGAGYLVARGEAQWRGDAHITIDGKALNAKMLAAVLKNHAPTSGMMDFTAVISGPTLKPVIDTQMFIDGGNLAGTDFDGFAAKVKIDTSDQITVKELSLTKGVFKTTVEGFIPFDAFKSKEKRTNPDASMNLNLHLNNANLGLLTGKYIESADGELTGKMLISGTLEHPELYGNLQIQKGSIRPYTFKKPITDVTLELTADGKTFFLKKLSGQSGKGRMELSGTFGMEAGELTSYKLQGRAVDFDLGSQFIKGVLNGSISLQPDKKGRPLIKAETFLENIEVNIPGVPEFDDKPMARIGLDVHVKLGKNVRVYNKMFFDMKLGGEIKMRGSTRYPIIDGSLEVLEGRVDYLRTPFKIQKASIGWPLSGSFIPHAKIEANTQLLQTDIKFFANGPVTQMNILLSSNPPLTQQEIFRLLTLKTRNNSSQVGASDAHGLLLTGLQMSVLGDLEYELTKRLGLSEFRIYQGDLYTGTSIELARNKVVRGRDTDKQYNLLVSKYLTDKWLVGYTFSNDFKYSLLYTQYSFSRQLNMSAGMDESKKMRYALEYKITF